MAAPLALRTTGLRAARHAQPVLPAFSRPSARTIFGSRQGVSNSKQARPQHVVSAAADETVDVDAIVKDLQAKWDGVENKGTVILYALGALVLLWLSSTIVSAINILPLVPKLLELVGLGYTGWFVYRYLLFKSSREELIQDVDELKKKISGVADETASKARSQL